MSSAPASMFPQNPIPAHPQADRTMTPITKITCPKKHSCWAGCFNAFGVRARDWSAQATNGNFYWQMLYVAPMELGSLRSARV